MRIGDLFPKQLNLRWYNNQIRKIQIDSNLTIILINPSDIGFDLLQFIKEIQTGFLLIFRVKDNEISQIQLFVETNYFQNCSVIIGIDDKEERYHTIMNIYTKVIKKYKKTNNSDSHSRILSQFLNQEDQESSWDDGNLIFNVLNTNQSKLESNTQIIVIQQHKILSISNFRLSDPYDKDQSSLILPKSIEQNIYKSLKQIMIKELIQALQLRSSQFKQYFRLRLSTQKIYKDLKLQSKYYLPVTLKVQNNSNIESKTQEILTIIQKASYDTLQIQQSRKFQMPSKSMMISLLQKICNDEELYFSYSSMLHIQWSYGDEIKESQYTIRKMLTQNNKYKWKMTKYYDEFKLVNQSLPKKQSTYLLITQLKNCLKRQYDQDILNQIVKNMQQDRWQIGEDYQPINDVYQISFINSTFVDETSPYQEKLDKIVINQENSFLIVFLINYQDPQNMNQLDQIISLPFQSDYRLVILSNCSFDNDHFEELINKKKIEKRIYSKNIQFWFPIQDQISNLTFSQYLDLFYNLNSKENVIIMNNKGVLCHRVTGFHLITMLQDKIVFEDEKKPQKQQAKPQNNQEQIKKLRLELKQTIEKEIKQQQQLSLQNEQDNNAMMKLDFKWPKEIVVKITKQKIENISKRYLKPKLINTSGLQLELISQIISNKQYDFL